MDCVLQSTTTLEKFCNLDTLNNWHCITTSTPFYYCNYQFSTSAFNIEATASLPSDLINSTYLITGILIFSFIIFVGYLVFRYIRF